MDHDPAEEPTITDLREIAEFIRARSLEEAGQAGSMDFYQRAGVTVEVRIPKSLSADEDSHRAKVEAWLEGHTPDRFMVMARELAAMADGLADVPKVVSEVFEPWQVRAAWRRLTAAARLWESHPEFRRVWAVGEGSSG